MALIFVGKDDRIGLNRPIYTEVFIVPENTRVVAGAVIGSHLVTDLGFVLKGTVTVEESWWNPQLRSFCCIKQRRDMLRITWRPFADIHSDVKNRPANNSHQFALGSRRFLKMQTADGSLSCRQRLIFLDKGYIRNLLSEPPVNPDFPERSARIGESPWNE